MPVQTSYPGVYIEEIPSQTRSITGVATSTAGFLGTFAKGPLNEAVQVFTFGDVEREFGGLSRDHEASYALRQFFQNGGSQAWVVRVAENADAAAAALNNTESPGETVLNVEAGRRVRTDSAANPGRWGDNLRIEVDRETVDPATRFNIAVVEVRLDNDRATEVQREEFRNLTLDVNDSRFVIDYVNARSRLVQVSQVNPLPANTVLATTGTMGAPIPALPNTADEFDELQITLVLDDGSGGPPVIVGPVALADLDADPLPATFAELAGRLESSIRALASDPNLETAPNYQADLVDYFRGATVRVVDGLNPGERRLRILTGRGARNFLALSRFAFAGTDEATYGLDVVEGNGQQIPLTGGTDGVLWDATHTTIEIGQNTFRGSQALSTGIHAFDDVEDVISILLLPEAAQMAPDGNAMRAVYSELMTYAETRRAMAIIDVPPAVTTMPAMQTWLDQNALLRSKNTCVYFPNPLIPDPENNDALKPIGASGPVAGQWSATDTARGVWKAPAGIETRLTGVPSLSYVLSDAQHGQLNLLGANCLRTFPVYGNIIWGARTLLGANALASEWKYLPVRRFFLFLEESLYRGTQWVVFEPNDEPLWASVRLSITAFLHGLYRQGAMQGSDPSQAYFVKCDSETTTQADIDAGILNIVVGVAPLKPAEFVILKFQQKTQGADT